MEPVRVASPLRGCLDQFISEVPVGVSRTTDEGPKAQTATAQGRVTQTALSGRLSRRHRVRRNPIALSVMHLRATARFTSAGLTRAPGMDTRPTPYDAPCMRSALTPRPSENLKSPMTEEAMNLVCGPVKQGAANVRARDP